MPKMTLNKPLRTAFAVFNLIQRFALYSSKAASAIFIVAGFFRADKTLPFAYIGLLGECFGRIPALKEL
jgi:hypothetical protein